MSHSAFHFLLTNGASERAESSLFEFIFRIISTDVGRLLTFACVWKKILWIEIKRLSCGLCLQDDCG